MKARTLLELGRISNLPTVWSNVLAGAVLSGGALTPWALLVAALAGSAFYVGGMFLNDAFDADVDARERPERPIPSGRAARSTVFAIGFGVLGLGLAALGVAVLAGSSPALLVAGIATAACVVVYDRWHKGYAFAPVVMGLCRAGVYCLGALAVSPALGGGVLVAALALALYVVGLTHLARFETASRVGRAWPAVFVLAPVALAAYRAVAAPALPSVVAPLLASGVALGWALFAIRLALRGGRNIGRAIVSLIAGISLVDAALIASAGALMVSLAAFAAFALTLAGQRYVRGT